MPIFGVNGRPRAVRWGMAVVVLSLPVAACGLLDRGTDHTFQDQGKICLFPEGTEPANHFVQSSMSLNFPADRGLLITVTAPTCLSGSCSSDTKAECSATVKGTVIEVTSKASFHEEGNTCTTDCRFLIARCATPPLPAGTYQVQHGAERLTVTVPSTTVPPCAGKAP